MKSHARIKNGEILFTSEQAKAFFLSKNEGKEILIETDDAITDNMRRYFEGCVVPIVYYTHPRSGWKSLKEAREAVKLEFLPSRTINSLKGSFRAMSVPSTANLNKDQFRKFVDAIVHWLLENHLCVEDDLDPENYIAWRDAAPEPGEIYPPLQRLKARYDIDIKKAFPWRKNEANSVKSEKGI